MVIIHYRRKGSVTGEGASPTFGRIIFMQGYRINVKIQGSRCPGVLPPIHRQCNFYKKRQQIIIKYNLVKLSSYTYVESRKQLNITLWYSYSERGLKDNFLIVLHKADFRNEMIH